MNKQLACKASWLTAALLALPLVQAQAADLSKTHYNAEKTRISADYQAERSACSMQAGNAKDICVEAAAAKQKVSLAELQYIYTGKAADETKLKTVRAEAAYAVAKEKCDDRAGNAKDVCVQEAKAVEAKALADAKMSRQIGEANVDAGEAKRDADYKVATEKCDAMAGDSKASCLGAAKAGFGKN